MQNTEASKFLLIYINIGIIVTGSVFFLNKRHSTTMILNQFYFLGSTAFFLWNIQNVYALFTHLCFHRYTKSQHIFFYKYNYCLYIRIYIQK